MSTSTRDALLEQGALLFARHGVTGVSTKQLHEAAGTRNESAVHYHFGGRRGLVAEILRLHLEAIEDRRARLVAAIVAEERTGDLRALVHALAAPMAEDLDTVIGRAHLRLVGQLNHPALAFRQPFEATEPAIEVETHAGAAVVRWLTEALAPLPGPVRTERLVLLREQLIGLLAARAQLLDEQPELCTAANTSLFLENLLDVLVAGLSVAPSPSTIAAVDRR